MKRIVLLLLVSLFLSCATQPSKNIPQTFDVTSSEGMIVGTISFKNEKPIFNNYALFCRGLNANRVISINPEQTIKMKFKPNFTDNDKAVYFFSITAPPGEYKFNELHLFSNYGYMTSTKTVPMDIPVRIEKGKVSYVGEIYINYNQALIQLNDMKERDLPKFKESFPLLNIE